MLDVKLVVVGGATEGDEFQLVLPSTLGRARSASIPLPHPLVSRQHCELIERDNRLFVRDLGSTNGTFVGSERVQEDTVVEHGALLTIGTVTFRAFSAGQPVTFEGSGADAANHGQSEMADTSTLTRVDTSHVGRAKPAVATRSKQKAK